MRHMFYRSFGTQNSMVTYIFKFELRKSQSQFKLSQIKSNFQIQNCLTETCLCCSVLSKHSKSVIYFVVRQLKMPKIAFPNKVTSSPLHGWFLPLHSQK